MPRLALAGDGDPENEFSIPAPLAPWRAPLIAAENLGDAFTELRQPLCRYLIALGLEPSEAEEVLQETFLRVCKQLKKDGQQTNLRGWIFRVAHNLARDHHRRRRRRPSEPLHNQLVKADPRVTAEQALIDHEQRQQLIAALGKLPERQRQCLHLRAEGLRYREIAEVLGAGVSTVAEWVHQALHTLGKECDEHK